MPGSCLEDMPTPSDFKCCVYCGGEDFQRKGPSTLGDFRNNGYRYFMEHLSAVRCLQLFTSITLILTLSLSEKRYHAHFIDEKSEVQR